MYCGRQRHFNVNISDDCGLKFYNRNHMIGPSGLQGLASFVQAVEAGSFTLAAARLGVSKSAVGKSIARLEQRLGVKLLNRTTRQLRLTTEGESFHQSCLRALSELEEAQALLASRRR